MNIKLTAIVPDGPILPDVARILELELTKEGKTIQGEYQKTTRTWGRKPQFTTQIDRVNYTVTVGTDSDVYKWVDEGTEPHVIVPVRAKALRFHTGYRPKTMSGFIGSRGGGVVGGSPVIFRSRVQHPGTKARRFTEIIGRRSQRRLGRNIIKAIRAQVGKRGPGRIVVR